MPKADNRNRWWVSPIIPTIGNAALAVLWVFSAFGGWGIAAFCETPETVDDGCRQGFAAAVTVSSPIAAVAVLVGIVAWALPGLRRRPGRLGDVLIGTALVWVIAEAVLFGGGWLVQS